MKVYLQEITIKNAAL